MESATQQEIIDSIDEEVQRDFVNTPEGRKAAATLLNKKYKEAGLNVKVYQWPIIQETEDGKFQAIIEA